MNPFIHLDEPQFKNIPSHKETDRFEAEVYDRFLLFQSLGSYEEAINHYSSCDPDDLGYAYEKAFVEWCSKALPSNWSSNVDLKAFCKEREQALTEELNKVVAEHLERTSGSVVHFPYSGKRKVSSYTSEFGQSCDIILDPAQIMVDINAGRLIAAAELNDPAKKKSIYQNRISHVQKKLIRWSRILTISALIFCISFFGTLLINHIVEETNLFFTMLAGQVVVSSLSIVLISLILFILSKRDLRDATRAPINFEPYVATIGFGAHRDYKVYDKTQVIQETKELHKRYRFRQLWGDACGRAEEWSKSSRSSEFYRKMEPFIVNGKDYVK